MRIKLLITALACIFFASAQEVGIVSHRQLLKGTEQGIFNPIISADGSKVLFTSDNLCGLKLYDFNDNVTLRITNAEMERLMTDIMYEAPGNGKMKKIAVTAEMIEEKAGK